MAILKLTESRPTGSSADRFPTTRWSRVALAVNPAAPDARAALAELCAVYWYPLYAFVRRKGHPPNEAEDMVQGFFAALLEKDGLAAVNREKGRFRSFLMAGCSHFMANRIDYENTLKRGRDRAIVPIDQLMAEDRYRNEPTHEWTAEKLFERRWATTLLERVLERLEQELSAAGKARLFEVMRPVLLETADRLSFAASAAVLGCTEGAARAAAHRLRARYRTLLREEVAHTLDDPDAVDDEIRQLFATFSS